MNRRDFSSASPACRPHRQPVTSLQKATVWIGGNAETVRGMSVKHGERCGEVRVVMGGAVTARPWLFLWGGVDQLVPSAAGPTKSFLPIWLWPTVVRSTRTPLQAPFTPLCKHTHALSAIPLTSIYDSPVVVEDYSALVQGRNCVQQVEGAQIPLRLQFRTISLTHLDHLNLR